MKTPVEIKRALKCCSQPGPCTSCAYAADDYRRHCLQDLTQDALAYINQLEAGIDRVYRMTQRLDVLTKEAPHE